jgi:multidrug efflux system membrane fusion protein
MTVETVSDDRARAADGGGRANRWVLGLVGLALVGGLGWLLRAKKPDAAGPAAGAPTDRPVPVVLATVTQADVPIWLEGLGSVVPLATVSIKSQVDGRLDRVAFKEGQHVKKGDLLAQIDPRPFQIKLEQAQATLARDQAQLANARLNLDRYKALREQNLIPQQQVDDQQASVDQQAAAVRADQAPIDDARLSLDYARITSPIDGVTGVRLVDPGNIVHPADPGPIVVVTQLDPIAVIFTLPEDDLPRLAKELAAGKVAVDAYSRDGAEKLVRGEVALIDNQINQATATIRIKALFPNEKRALWPNQFVKARLLLTTRKAAIVVPAAVVQRGPQGAFAYVVGPGRTASPRPIEVDSLQGEQAIVAKGLAPGEEVVADGQAQLRPGSKIAPRGAEGASAPPDGSGAPAASAAPGGSGAAHPHAGPRGSAAP